MDIRYKIIDIRYQMLKQSNIRFKIQILIETMIEIQSSGLSNRFINSTLITPRQQDLNIAHIRRQNAYIDCRGLAAIASVAQKAHESFQ